MGNACPAICLRLLENPRSRDNAVRDHLLIMTRTTCGVNPRFRQESFRPVVLPHPICWPGPLFGEVRGPARRHSSLDGYEVRPGFLGTTGREINTERVRRRVTAGTDTTSRSRRSSGGGPPLRRTSRKRLGRSGPSTCSTTATVRRDTSQASRRYNQVGGIAIARVGDGDDPATSISTVQPYDEAGAVTSSGLRTERHVPTPPNFETSLACARACYLI